MFLLWTLVGPDMRASHAWVEFTRFHKIPSQPKIILISN
jgi:hypothetical protein